jgi:2-phosphosulfolactate phosphatase
MGSMRHIAVDLHPHLTDTSALADTAAVAIDVLRATTTIVHALSSAAREVVVFEEVAEAIAQSKAWWQSATVLGGERDGVKIEGFDLGNSPSEYNKPAVAGRAVFFTTTNGTRALHKCRTAKRIFAGALVNRQAVVNALRDETKVRIVCAGTRGEITRDDALGAGAIVAGLVDGRLGEYELDDEAAMVLDAWHGLVQPLADQEPAAIHAAIAEALRHSLGGRNLLALGLDVDIVAAAQLDTFNVLPELDPATMSLRLR